MNLTFSPRKPRIYRGLVELDRILRGETTRPDDIRQADIRLPILGVTATISILAMVYGLCMGVFALIHGFENGLYQRACMQAFATITKVPLLYGLTLLVTFPSLYVFNALVGSQLKIFPVFKLLIASLAVNLAVLASLGPILAFFSVSTPNYSFIVLLNVLIFTLAGVLGLSFLMQTLNRLTCAHCGQLPTTTPKIKDSSSTKTSQLHLDKTGPLDQLDGVVLSAHVRKVFVIWIVVFGLVGAQMGWVLRPFIGSPHQPFEWFRARDSNFFEAVFQNFQNFMMDGS